MERNQSTYLTAGVKLWWPIASTWAGSTAYAITVRRRNGVRGDTGNWEEAMAGGRAQSDHVGGQESAVAISVRVFVLVVLLKTSRVTKFHEPLTHLRTQANMRTYVGMTMTGSLLWRIHKIVKAPKMAERIDRWGAEEMMPASMRGRADNLLHTPRSKDPCRCIPHPYRWISSGIWTGNSPSYSTMMIKWRPTSAPSRTTKPQGLIANIAPHLNILVMGPNVLAAKRASLIRMGGMNLYGINFLRVCFGNLSFLPIIHTYSKPIYWISYKKIPHPHLILQLENPQSTWNSQTCHLQGYSTILPIQYYKVYQ